MAKDRAKIGSRHRVALPTPVAAPDVTSAPKPALTVERTVEGDHVDGSRLLRRELPRGPGRLPTRLTAVLVRRDGEWRVAHAHFSVAVPDEIALSQASAWLEELGEPAGPRP